MVAVSAGGNHVRPVLAALLAGRDHMVESEFFGIELFAAVLAGIIIANVDVLAGELHAAHASWSHVFFKADNAGHAEFRVGASRAVFVELENFHFPLKPEDERFLPAYEFNGLIA